MDSNSICLNCFEREEAAIDIVEAYSGSSQWLHFETLNQSFDCLGGEF